MKTTYTRHGVHYDFEPDCFGGYALIKEIGQGAYGSVFLALKTGEDIEEIHALKLIPLNVSIPGKPCRLLDSMEIQEKKCRKQTTEEFLQELRISRWMGEENVGPKVIAGGICEKVKNIHQGNINVGYIIQEYWPMTLYEFASNHLENYSGRVNFGKIFKILQLRAQRLDELGLIHKDLHSENILVSVDAENKVNDGVFIDFDSLDERDETQSKTYNSENLEKVMRNLGMQLAFL